MSKSRVDQQRASKCDAQERVGVQSLACIIVTYNPDVPIFRRLLDMLPADAAIVIIDNASDGGVCSELDEFAVRHKYTHIVVNEHNLGLAAAINQGIRKAHRLWPEICFALLLDQDSEPEPGSIEVLLDAFVRLKQSRVPVGCIGPCLIDPVTGLSHGFHQIAGWRWIRVYPAEDDSQPISCANLNGSGTLIPIGLFLELGGLEEALFIDHVDTEWAFRVQAAGYALYGIPQAHFIHRMGDTSCRIWLFGWHVWPMRSPQRHYYLFRNAVRLMRRDYVPPVWKIWAVPKLLFTAVVQGLIDPRRASQLACMIRGVRDGVRKDTP